MLVSLSTNFLDCCERMMKRCRNVFNDTLQQHHDVYKSHPQIGLQQMNNTVEAAST